MKTEHIDGTLVAPVPAYEGRYAAANDGRIWAYPNASRKVGRWMKPRIDRCGYAYVTLFKDGVRKYPKVHRLVLSAFSGGSADPLQVNHINGNKADNQLQNLEWVTASRNRKHAFELGLQVVTQRQREASRQNITNWNQSKP
jgi:hypothetical protein